MSRPDNVDPDLEGLEEELKHEVASLEQELAQQFGDKEDGPEDAPAEKVPKAPKSDQHKEEEIVLEPVPIGNGKKPRKDDLVTQILRLGPLVDGYNMEAVSTYKRMRVADLQALVADLHNRATQQLNGDEGEPEGEEPEERQERLARKVMASNAFVGKALFSLHLVLSQFCEIASERFEPKTGTSLRGLVDDSNERRDEIQNALADIYEENKDWLGPLLTPTNRYAMIMATMCANRAYVNKKNLPADSAGSAEE